MVRGMQVEDVDTVSAQLVKAGVEVFLQVLGLVDAGLEGVHLGSERQAAIFPPGLAGPRLLLSANIRARSINLIVALGLEIIEMFGEFIKVGYTGSGALIGTYSALLGAL